MGLILILVGLVFIGNGHVVIGMILILLAIMRGRRQ